MHVDAVFFDLFNTLVLIENDDVFYLPSLKKLHKSLVQKGVNVSFSDFKRVYFEVRDKLYAGAEKNLEEPHFNVRISETLQRFGYNFDVSHPVIVGASEAFCKEFMRYMRLDDDAIYVLNKLHGKYKLGLISNFALPECVVKIFEKFGLKGLFEVVIVSGTINKRKPSSEVFEKALRTLGVEASRAIFVGDTPALDVKGARNVGIKSVLIKRDTSPPADSISLVYKPSEEDAKVEADIVIESLTELLSVLEDC
jgi:HAD superfamily hydrolase (TIGR01549 family)